VHFSVRDTGLGIPADRLDRLFRSFSQVDASTTRRYGGTGLGLAISKRLSEMMGGTMWVESEGVPGQGSVFHFTIQAEAMPHPAQIHMPGAEAHLRSKRVLIVDDNATNRRILIAQTEGWGMIPVATESPLEALNWVRQSDSFDLALLDMNMPEMDGLTLAQEIRRDHPATALPLVMLTSLGRREVGAEAAEFAAYLTKPVRQSQLYNALVSIFVGRPVMVMARTKSEPKIDTRLAERLPLRILLAEDNTTNQRLALQILHKMGYRADVAADGLEVLQALERQSYDLILMDMQMPEMDGLEATRHIRSSDFPADKQPRIIALTANAMRGDRELCLAAGMDDYITKPIRIEELQAMLERWGRPATRVTEPTSVPDSPPGPLDWTMLEQLALLQEEGQPDFVQEIIELYLATAPSMIVEIQQAVRQGHPDQVRQVAHSLKGSSHGLGAMRVGEISAELEAKGRSGSIEGVDSLLADLEREFEHVRQALQDWRVPVA
jgi:CheY-like chemotaxis protein/HPt (histidine-containing phosphotransfer) domain-containing protein